MFCDSQIDGGGSMRVEPERVFEAGVLLDSDEILPVWDKERGVAFGWVLRVETDRDVGDIAAVDEGVEGLHKRGEDHTPVDALAGEVPMYESDIIVTGWERKLEVDIDPDDDQSPTVDQRDWQGLCEV